MQAFLESRQNRPVPHWLLFWQVEVPPGVHVLVLESQMLPVPQSVLTRQLGAALHTPSVPHVSRDGQSESAVQFTGPATQMLPYASEQVCPVGQLASAVHVVGVVVVQVPRVQA